MTEEEKKEKIFSNLESLDSTIECAGNDLMQLIELIKSYNDIESDGSIK